MGLEMDGLAIYCQAYLALWTRDAKPMLVQVFCVPQDIPGSKTDLPYFFFIYLHISLANLCKLHAGIQNASLSACQSFYL